MNALVATVIACAASAPNGLTLAQDGLVRPPVVQSRAEIRTSTLVALPGLPIRVQLSPPPGAPIAGWVPEPLPVSLVDPNGTGLATALVSEIIGFSPNRAAPTDGGTPWLAQPTDWSAVLPEQAIAGQATGPVYWSLFIRLPAEYDVPGARTPVVGRDRAVLLDIGGERFPARLAEQPEVLPTGLIQPIDAPAAEWRSLGDLIRSEAADPARRWRASLLAERFTPGRLFGTTSLEEFVEIENPLLNGLSQTIEGDVRSSLSELAAADPTLAAELLEHLTAVSRDLSGRLMPAWPTDGEVETVVFPALRSRALTAAERAERVRSYLNGRPNSRSNVIDDAGSAQVISSNARFRDGGETVEQILVATGATILTSNLVGTGRTLTYGAPGEFDAQLLQLPPHASVVMRLDPSVARSANDAPSTRDGNATSGAVELRDGTRVTRLESQVVPMPIDRPGLQLGPALRPWTLASWNTDTVSPVPLDEQTSVLLFRDDGASTWRVLLEVRNNTESEAAHSVEIHFGPYGATSDVVSISPDSADVVRSEDRWSIIFEVPEAAIRRSDETGFIEVGFVRTLRAAPEAQALVHSSWPRPWFPGQTEPGRFRVDLNSWSND